MNLISSCLVLQPRFRKREDTKKRNDFACRLAHKSYADNRKKWNSVQGKANVIRDFAISLASNFLLNFSLCKLFYRRIHQKSLPKYRNLFQFLAWHSTQRLAQEFHLLCNEKDTFWIFSSINNWRTHSPKAFVRLQLIESSIFIS